MNKRLWRRLGAAVIASSLVMGAIAGCEKTPENSIIKEKGSKAIKGYESLGEDEGVSLVDKLNIPEHYTNNASYEDGGLVIDTDAQVIVPQVSSIDTINVSAVKADSSLLDTVTKAFFGDSKIYDATTYLRQTKEQLQNQLTQLKKYKAEGNIDPYNYGKDENGNLQYDIDAEIERYENEINTAPENVEKKEIKPEFGIEYIDEKTGQVEKMDDSFGGVVETDNGNYDYMAFISGPDVKFEIRKIRTDLPDLQEFSAWQEGEYIMDSTLVPWSYERCDIIVGENGIAQAELLSPYKVGEVQTENVKLMDFNSIMEIYEQMMEVSNVDILNYEKKRTFHIKKITLGYSRIYNPESKNDEGLLVPVWDFFGAFDVEGELVEEDESGRRTTPISEKHSGEHSNQSFMTINAIDGTVIDRSLGY